MPRTAAFSAARCGIMRLPPWSSGRVICRRTPPSARLILNRKPTTGYCRANFCVSSVGITRRSAFAVSGANKGELPRGAPAHRAMAIGQWRSVASSKPSPVGDTEPAHQTVAENCYGPQQVRQSDASVLSLLVFSPVTGDQPIRSPCSCIEWLAVQTKFNWPPQLSLA